MNKPILLAVFIVIISILFFVTGRMTPESENTDNLSTPTLTPPKNMNNIAEIDTGNGIKSAWILVRDPKKILLFSNLEDKLTSTEARQKHGCLYLISGGFYSKENKHIGQFIANGSTLSESVNSALFNGFLSIPEAGRPTISFTPEPSPRIGLQTGPVLIYNRQLQKLSDSNDNARRIVAAITRERHVVFFVLFNKDSAYAGPTLEEIPEMLQTVQQNTSLSFTDAINLDGGTASAFISDTVTLSEVSRIGSYFCILP